MGDRLDLYHRTSEEAARAILGSGRFVTRENTRQAYASTHADGQAAGYGPAVVHVRVDEHDAELDDEFPDGEQHYRIPLERAEVVEAFILGPEGQHTSLLGTVTTAGASSFPDSGWLGPHSHGEQPGARPPDPGMRAGPRAMSEQAGPRVRNDRLR